MKCLIELQKDVIDYSKAVISTYPTENRKDLASDWKTYIFTNNDDLKNAMTGTKNSIKLDGTFQLYKNGFVDISRSNNVGNVGSSINITFEHPINIFEIDIEFGRVFATNMHVSFEHGTAIISEAFENNSQHCKIEYVDTNITSLYFNFDKVNTANDFLQINAVSIKENIELTDDDISNLSLYSKHNLLCDEIRQGEAKIEIINAKEKFNILNDSDKNYYSLMQKNQKVIIYDDDNVKIGTYFIDNMTNSDDTGIATLYCNDVTTFLNAKYENSLYGFYNFEERLKDILSHSDYAIKYEISQELKNISAKNGFNYADKCKDALIYLCIAYNANFIVKNDGTIYFYKQNNSLAYSSFAGDIKSYVPKLINTNYNINVDYIDMNNIVQEKSDAYYWTGIRKQKYNINFNNGYSLNLQQENLSAPNKFITTKVNAYRIESDVQFNITVANLKAKLDYVEFEITNNIFEETETAFGFEGYNIKTEFLSSSNFLSNSFETLKVSNDYLISDSSQANEIVTHRADYYNMFNCEIEYTIINPDLTKLKVGGSYYITISNNKNFYHFVTEIEYKAETRTAIVKGVGHVAVENKLAIQ